MARLVGIAAAQPRQANKHGVEALYQANRVGLGVAAGECRETARTPLPVCRSKDRGALPALGVPAYLLARRKAAKAAPAAT